jgi:hypothetical protein
VISPVAGNNARFQQHKGLYMGTKPTKATKQPTATKVEQGTMVGDLLKGTPKVNSAHAKAVTEEDVIACAPACKFDPHWGVIGVQI